MTDYNEFVAALEHQLAHISLDAWSVELKNGFYACKRLRDGVVVSMQEHSITDMKSIKFTASMAISKANNAARYAKMLSRR